MNYNIRFYEYLEEVNLKDIDFISETYENSGLMTFVREVDDDFIDVFMCPKNNIACITMY